MIVSVADTGLGMTQEVLEGLLTAMKGHRTAKIGIGLGNIYKRVHSMYVGGDVKVYSRAGGGTVVQILLPAAAIEERI